MGTAGAPDGGLNTCRVMAAVGREESGPSVLLLSIPQHQPMSGLVQPAVQWQTLC